MLTKTQINKIKKAMKNGTGVDIMISMSQRRKAVKEGGNLFTSSIPLLRGTVLPLAKKVVGPLMSGAIGLASLGVNKIFGKGQIGGFFDTK